MAVSEPIWASTTFKEPSQREFDLMDAEGIVLGGKTVQVEAEGLKQINSVARFAFEDSVGSDINGNLYLESDQPISAWASQIDNATNDPSLLLSKQTGTTRILIPSAANIGAFSSSLVLMNVGYTTAQVALKAYGTSGELLGESSAPLTIAPNGVMSFENVLQSLGVSDNYGPIEISSLNNVPLVATSRVSSAARSGGFFEGLKYFEASWSQTIAHVVDNSEIRTNLGINNTTDLPATVTIRLFDRNGTQLASTVVPVSPRGLTQVNNVVRQLLNLQTSELGWEHPIGIRSADFRLGFELTTEPTILVCRESRAGCHATLVQSLRTSERSSSLVS
jgi:hypothetical protein